MALFRALDHFDDTYWDDDLLGWDKFAAGVDLFRVPGDHVNMVNEPNVRVLAEQLRECLDRALTPRNSVELVAKSASAGA